MIGFLECGPGPALGGADGEFFRGNLVFGFVVSYFAVAVMQRHVPALRGYSQRVPRFLRFAVFFIKELIVANVRVAYDVITPVWYMKPGVIGYELGGEDGHRNYTGCEPDIPDAGDAQPGRVR